jgi:hypothetical protein
MDDKKAGVHFSVGGWDAGQAAISEDYGVPIIY